MYYPCTIVIDTLGTTMFNEGIFCIEHAPTHTGTAAQEDQKQTVCLHM